MPQYRTDLQAVHVLSLMSSTSALPQPAQHIIVMSSVSSFVLLIVITPSRSAPLRIIHDSTTAAASLQLSRYHVVVAAQQGGLKWMKRAFSAQNRKVTKARSETQKSENYCSAAIYLSNRKRYDIKGQHSSRRKPNMARIE